MLIIIKFHDYTSKSLKTKGKIIRGNLLDYCWSLTCRRKGWSHGDWLDPISDGETFEMQQPFSNRLIPLIWFFKLSSIPSN